MKYNLNQKAVFHLNRINNRVRQITQSSTSINTNEGISSLLQQAAKLNDPKTQQYFRHFLLAIDDNKTKSHIHYIIPQSSLL